MVNGLARLCQSIGPLLIMESIVTLTTFDNNTVSAGLVEAFDACKTIVGHGTMISRTMRYVSWRLVLMGGQNVVVTLFYAKGDGLGYVAAKRSEAVWTYHPRSGLYLDQFRSSFTWASRLGETGQVYREF